MKKKQKTKRLLLILLIILVFIIGVVFLVKAFYQPMKTYHSDFFKITIEYPATYELEERFGTIRLKKREGEIRVGRNGTNYESVDKYLENLSKLNHFVVTEKEEVKFKYEFATRVIIDNQKKDYFFYPDPELWAVYILSASSPELYGDLDKIAESFRYEP